MDGLRDRVLLWFCCIALLWGQPVGALGVVVMLTAVTISASNGYMQSPRLLCISSCIYVALCVVWPSFCLFLPLVGYDVFRCQNRWIKLATVLPVIPALISLPSQIALMVAALLAVAHLLGWASITLNQLTQNLARVRDDSYEFASRLEQKNHDLLEKQDYEVRLATLNERNRIAREIHDQVGHLLSRSILQVGAMMVAQRDQAGRNQLASLRDTLSQAMDSIRASVHDLHEESVDLYMQLTSLVDGFLFCPVRLDYRLESEPDKQVQYCFMAIVKEGLHNVARHSNATQVTLTVLEHPALYQLILQDNGSPTGDGRGQGMGLQNMAERVEALGGQFLAGYQDGFRIFVSVPKGR